MHNTPSPRPDNDETIEAAIIMAGANVAPRVTQGDIAKAVKSEQFYVFPDTMLTVCVLTLDNGFTITGESACASPANFNKEIGQRVARENAMQKIWPLLGFRLKDRLRDAVDLAKETTPTSYQDRVRLEQQDLGRRYEALAVFMRSLQWRNVNYDERVRLAVQHDLMGKLNDVLLIRIAAFTAEGYAEGRKAADKAV